jgi:hypothetical protein
MKLTDIRKMAEQDAVIDSTELGTESIKIPQLHNKYLVLMQDEKFALQQMNIQFYQMKRLKWEYYTGKMDKETLDSLGWQPFQLNVLKKDLDLYFDADEDLVELKGKIIYQDSKIDFLENTLKTLNNRNWVIRNAIEWNKFIQGGH